MGVSPSRKIAYDVLRRVEAEGAYASDLLHAALTSRVKPDDAALATEITLGVLRWRRLLDFLLERHLKKPVGRLDLPVILALRMGQYQLRFLDKIPARAAINESVELVKSARKSSAAGLVNAVLHRAESEAESAVEAFLPPDVPLSERLGILHSHPTWLVERWLLRLGEQQTVALLRANNQTPKLSCAVQDFSRCEEVLSALTKAGLRTQTGVLLRNAFSVSGGSPAQTEAFRAGEISIQDEASQAVPLLLAVQAGDRVLDLCAAPGGKTAALMRAAGGTGVVIAADRHSHRLAAMRGQLDRLAAGRAHLVELDAEQPLPFQGRFDRILLDAPCSGTGTLARHPEIRWRLELSQLAESHKHQVSMLRMALLQLAPSGRLVYSTCSMEPEENEEVVEEVLRDTPSVQRIPPAEVAEAVTPHLAAGVDPNTLFDADGYFRTSPSLHHTDGFFAAILASADRGCTPNRARLMGRGAHE
ncbi:MAG TPA: 16S rRNA (cytosine(967)-C(5))-methyltransferase RsmB [Candidatus Acidoferrales bacterium]|nr:16S rRNA (cytosine(967)-C(5))-methyltransferase RsmB [Candidatus Acidoferrales bacterium]